MIKVIESSRVNWLVNYIMPKGMASGECSLLGLDPIIAGGSMLAVYRAVKLYDTPDRWAEFQRVLERDPRNARIDRFNDVDLWFEKTNPIYNPSHQFHELVRTDSENSNQVQKVFNSLADKSNPYGELSLTHLQTYHVALFSGKLGLRSESEKRTKWANTFRYEAANIGNGTLQVVQTKISSVKELLDSFDYINCSVAWYRGKLYYDDRIDQAFSEFELQLNNDAAYIGDSSIASRVFNALRAFKYTKRYLLDFDPNLTEHIFKLYFDTKDLDYSAYKNKVIKVKNNYGQQISSVKTLESMVGLFHRHFEEFMKMKHFKREYALYLVDKANKFAGLKAFIERGDSQEDSAASLSIRKAITDLMKQSGVIF
jgi:hypothetical protein